MSETSDPMDTLATHMMLDPYVQQKLVESITDALKNGYLNTPKGFDPVIVDNLITAIFYHPIFKSCLLQEIKKLQLHAEPDYSGTYTTNKIVLRYSDNTGS